tara:strand:- start:853 stop:1059 length:207 start_codon:yes stop_codon:yes gene_type:complete
MSITLKPQLDRCRQWVASIEAEAKMSPIDKARLLSCLEGIIAERATYWRRRAAAWERSRGSRASESSR